MEAIKLNEINGVNVPSIVNLNDRRIALLTQSSGDSKRSDKYKPYTTLSALKVFFDAGFYVSGFDAPKSHFAAHLVRLRHDNLRLENGDFIEVIVFNSYDGTKPLMVYLGVFRGACANGLIFGSFIFESRVKHIGQDFYTRVASALNGAQDKVHDAKTLISRLQSTELNNAQIIDFARKAFEKRLSDVKNLHPMTDNQLRQSLRIVRSEDNGRDAWTVLNVIQEKIMRGGIHYSHDRIIKDDQGNEIGKKLSHRSTRQLTRPSRTVELNTMLFDDAVSLLDVA